MIPFRCTTVSTFRVEGCNNEVHTHGSHGEANLGPAYKKGFSSIKSVVKKFAKRPTSRLIFTHVFPRFSTVLGIPPRGRSCSGLWPNLFSSLRQCISYRQKMAFIGFSPRMPWTMFETKSYFIYAHSGMNMVCQPVRQTWLQISTVLS